MPRHRVAIARDGLARVRWRSALSYLQAILLGVIQGVTELFPVSSLGHSVILPKLLGWDGLVAAQQADESFFLAFLVGLHVATALALLLFYRSRWASIVTATLRSIGRQKIDARDARIGWLLVVATIPAAVAGLVLEHRLRVLFATPMAAAVLLLVNGVMLLLGEQVRRRRRTETRRADGTRLNRPLEWLEFREAFVVGVAQAAALLPGISRSGITMVAGLVRGLDHADAAEFSFLLATPIILGAGLYKLPDLLGPNGDGVRGQVVVGSLAAGIAAYLSVRFLTTYFRRETLVPFGIYSIAVGLVAILLVR
jgi:undecaprenyl-diphosphatase